MITLFTLDKFAEAEALFRRTLTGREKALGVDNLDTMASADILALAQYSQDRLAEAEALHRPSLRKREDPRIRPP